MIICSTVSMLCETTYTQGVLCIAFCHQKRHSLMAAVINNWKYKNIRVALNECVSLCRLVFLLVKKNYGKMFFEKITYTLEPHLAEHPWDQASMFAQVGSVLKAGLKPRLRLILLVVRGIFVAWRGTTIQSIQFIEVHCMFVKSSTKVVLNHTGRSSFSKFHHSEPPYETCPANSIIKHLQINVHLCIFPDTCGGIT